MCDSAGNMLVECYMRRYLRLKCRVKNSLSYKLQRCNINQMNKNVSVSTTYVATSSYERLCLQIFTYIFLTFLDCNHAYVKHISN